MRAAVAVPGQARTIHPGRHPRATAPAANSPRPAASAAFSVRRSIRLDQRDRETGEERASLLGWRVDDDAVHHGQAARGQPHLHAVLRARRHREPDPAIGKERHARGRIAVDGDGEGRVRRGRGARVHRHPASVEPPQCGQLQDHVVAKTAAASFREVAPQHGIDADFDRTGGDERDEEGGHEAQGGGDGNGARRRSGGGARGRRGGGQLRRRRGFSRRGGRGPAGPGARVGGASGGTATL